MVKLIPQKGVSLFEQGGQNGKLQLHWEQIILPAWALPRLGRLLAPATLGARTVGVVPLQEPVVFKKDHVTRSRQLECKKLQHNHVIQAKSV